MVDQRQLIHDDAADETTAAITANPATTRRRIPHWPVLRHCLGLLSGVVAYISLFSWCSGNHTAFYVFLNASAVCFACLIA